MKYLFFILFFLTFHAMAQNCPPGMMNAWSESKGYRCLPRLTKESEVVNNCVETLSPLSHDPFSSFPAIFRMKTQPWWATQGELLYPNVHYPGPWSYPGIEAQYYSGKGEIFAAKPNVYVDSIHQTKKFNFKFISPEKPHFLATTPVIGKSLQWSGKIEEKDKFQVEGIFYDYLFYDVRLPKEKMQFENGVCATREGAIQWMLKDLHEMRYSSLSKQDFEEHWRVKIPDYPFYCIYPQYNRELDPILPVEIDMDYHTFIRALYVLIPHKKEPDIEEPQEITLPTKDPAQFRPGTKIKREVEFREWGVAFIGY